jgi:hypothetical protein
MIADALQANRAVLTGNINGLLSSLHEPAPTHVVEPLWVAPSMPDDLKRHIKVLYASHQTGTALPGFIRFALAGLAGAGYDTTLITTQQDLDVSSRSFLDKLGIELFPTENRGFDFGMWQRYLESVPAETRGQWTRVLLINDSVIYFRDRFDEFIRLAEANPADALSLSSNTDYGFHLQSYFLYLKPSAISVLEAHMNKSKHVQHYWDAVMNLEIGFSRNLTAAGLTIAPLFKTNRPFDFCYEQLIQSGAGFIKRKLLEKRYTFGQTLHFLRNDRRALDMDYRTHIMTRGNPNPAYDAVWLNAHSTMAGHNRLSQPLERTLFWGGTVISIATCLLLGLFAGIAARQGTGVAMAALLALTIFALAMALLTKLRSAIATTTMTHPRNYDPPSAQPHRISERILQKLLRRVDRKSFH